MVFGVERVLGDVGDVDVTVLRVEGHGTTVVEVAPCAIGFQHHGRAGVGGIAIVDRAAGGQKAVADVLHVVGIVVVGAVELDVARLQGKSAIALQRVGLKAVEAVAGPVGGAGGMAQVGAGERALIALRLRG